MEVFDDLSRIVATPMSRRSTLRLILAAFAAKTFGSPIPAGRAGSMWPLTKIKKGKRLNAAETASRLRLAYLSRNNYAYRTEVFNAFWMLRRIDGIELQNTLNALVADIQKNGADGLESFVLACVDAIGTRTRGTSSSAAANVKLHASLKALDHGLHFWSAATPPNMRIPLGRVSSPLVLDVRADAARTLLQQLALLNRGERDVQTIIDLLDAKEAQGALCPPNLPTQQNQDDELSAADKSRTSNCDSHGAAGANGSGTVQGTLGDLTLSGCLQMPPSAIATLTARLKAMDKCMDSLAGSAHLPPDVAMGAVAFAVLLAAIGAAIGVAATITAAVIQTKVGEREQNRRDAAQERAQNWQKQVSEFVNAWNDVNTTANQADASAKAVVTATEKAAAADAKVTETNASGNAQDQMLAAILSRRSRLYPRSGRNISKQEPI